VDEAYFHYAEGPDYESVIPLVKDHSDLIVARTCSKIYGMAGLRYGYCAGNAKRLTNGVRINRGIASIIMALAAATASLDDVDQVQNGRHSNSEKRVFVHRPDRCDGLQTDPVAGELHHDRHKTPGRVIQALKQRNVHVGRLFPAFPNYMRVTIGKNVEMETFVSAFGQAMA
jgi:histidinol-phosphate aminotransferase